MSTNDIRILGDVEVSGALSFGKNFADFPVDPKPRTIVVKQGVPYIYTELINGSGYFSWQPMGLKQASYLHTQGVASTAWTVTHNFNSTDFAYFVYDNNHRLMLANIEIVDNNTAIIHLSEATTGTVVMFSLQYVNAVTVEATSNITLGTLTLRDANGVITVNNNPVAMAQAVAASFAQVYTKAETAKIASDAVAVETAARIAADAALSARIDDVVSNIDPAALDSMTEIVAAFKSADGNLNNAITSLGTSANSAIAAEATARAAGDTGTLNAAKAYVDGKILDESNLRADGDASVLNQATSHTDTAVAAEASLRIAGDAATLAAGKSYADDIVANEAISRASGDASTLSAANAAMATAVNAEATLRASADAANLSTAKTYADDAVAAEAAIRTSGDAATALGAKNYTDSQIDLEAIARTSGDAATLAAGKTYTDGAVASEAAFRTNAVNAAVTTAQSYTDAKIADSIVALTGSVSTAAADASTYTDAAVAAEAVLRVSGDADTLAAGKVYADGVVSSEASLRVSGDAATLASAKAYADSTIQAVIGAAPAALDTLQEIAAQLASDESAVTALASTVAGKASASSVTALETLVNTKASADSVTTETNARIAGDAATLASAKAYSDAALAGKAAKATTLAGYGITDAYSKSGVDSSVLAETQRAEIAEAGLAANIASESIRAVAAETALSNRIADLKGVSVVAADLAPVATSGLYSDLIGTPTAVSAFSNDVGYQTAAAVANAISGKADIVSVNQGLALKANAADVSVALSQKADKSGLFSGRYADLTGAPAAVSAFTNDANYQSGAAVDAKIQAVIGAAPSSLKTLGDLATALANDESAAAALTNQVSALSTTVSGKADKATTLVGYGITDAYTKIAVDAALDHKANITSLASVATSGRYTDLTGTPTAVSSFTNDAGYQNASQVQTAIAAAGYAAASALSTVALTGAYADLTGKPTLFSGSYADLTNKPALFSGSYADLIGKPALFSGNYSDLRGLPTLPTNVSDLTNDAGYQTAAQVSDSIQSVVGAAPGALNTLAKIATQLAADEISLANMVSTVSGKADKATTLAGYGITDAYTKTAADAKLVLKADQTYVDNQLALKANASDLAALSSKVYADGVASSTLASANTYTDTKVAALVASAPAALDTLNELATALGNDANFATTTATSLGNRLRVDIDTQSLSASQKVNARTNLGLAAVASSGAYADLSGKPTIPTAVSGLTNDAGYLSQSGVRNAISVSGGLTYNATTGVIGFVDAVTSVAGKTGVVVLTTADIGEDSSAKYYTDARARAAVSFVAGAAGYNAATGVISIPTNTSQLTNGAGFLTSYTETDTLASVTARGATTSTAVSLNGGVNTSVVVIDSLGTIDTASLVTSTTAASQVLDTNAISAVRTVKYLVQITSGTAYQSIEMMVLHDGTNVNLVAYANISTGGDLAAFDADISGGNMRLLVTPVNAATTFKVIKTAVAV